MAFLSTNAGTPGASRFELTESETTIGRHPDCHIVVDAGAVSRFHAKVTREGGNFSVLDLGSRNGTYLNGQLLQNAQSLHEGDRIRISDVELVFHHLATPAFASSSSNSEMTFDGSSFGVMMVDDEPDSDSMVPASRVEYKSSADGLMVRATAEAKLDALTEISRHMANVQAVDEVLPKVLDSLFVIFPSADRGFVVMEGDKGDLVTRFVRTRAVRDETETVRISRTIVRKVMSSGEAILSFDAMEDSRFDNSESISDFSIKSMICAPLTDGEGRAFGAIQIDSTQGRGQFVEKDIDLLSGVAAQAGILIHNAKMHEQALHQREVEQDLKLATEVQQAFLPQSPPDAPGFCVASHYQAANHIGGDYFDYIHFGDGRVGIVVADVVGHGVAAAMFMAKLSAETRFCLASDHDVARAVERLNDRMSRLEVERFVTFLLIVVDPANPNVTIVNAGHMAPVMRKACDGSIEEPGEEESGLPIAIDTGMDYEAVEVLVEAGDVLVMYTDGVNEAMDAEDNEFGMEAVREITRKGGSAEEICGRIVQAVHQHIGAAPPFDDMCLVVIERTENPKTAVAVGVETVDEDVIETVL
ncbi:SpoIIE family protein phosphatase [Stieleria varia]|uniref:Glycogen accumulation regulator GarA n=1 Tax=Stieleria varia TaxID=2528005 RepID=A0A5C6B112_9BACT|nr:SpoIIE family protein phosphatase [Stieleria varia]TWU05477.1 Glycogen accumulation regulator GarA [Stieleria varia]